MLESNIEAGCQHIPADRRDLRYGVSVTDPCVDWPTTEEALLRARDDLAPVLAARRRAAASG
jgi:3-deoxy-7-phosphoheptulonate synthase